MRQMALPRAESGAKSRGSTSSTVTPSSLARAASSRGVRSVRVVPGWMQLTVIPKRPICTGRVLVRCTSEVLRAPPLRLPALRALVPLMLMMRPHFCSFRYGMTARAQRSAPTYFTLKSWSRSSSTTDSIGPVADAEPPGGEPLFTRMCRPPSWFAAWATIASTWARLVTSAASGMTRRPLELLLGAGDDRHVDPFAGQLPRDGLADAKAASGHDRVLASEPQVHCAPSVSLGTCSPSSRTRFYPRRRVAA